MIVWRDSWDDMPNLVIAGVDPVNEKEGILEDSLLFVLDPTDKEVIVYSQDGASWQVILPDESLSGEYMHAGIDLQMRRGGSK